MRRGWWLGLCCGLLGSAIAWGDEFERIEGKALTDIPKSPDAKAQSSLTFAQIEALPGVLRDTRSTLLVATTDQGNFTRLLVSPAFRKSTSDPSKLIPVVVFERFDTFDAGNIATRVARGRELILFDGFQLDLDSGQVVPEGQGGDLQFVASGKRLVALGKAKLFTLTKAPAGGVAEARRPSIGRGVLTSDFAGRYRLFANGQWSGTLDLKVDPAGTVAGRFRSDLDGSSYQVSGQVDRDVPQKVTFRIAYPRTHQDYEGLIWTEGKGAMAGTLTMLDRAYGFFAIRDGARFGPEGEDFGPVTRGADRPGRRTVTLRKGRYALDGKPKTDQELTDALKRAAAADPATWVLLQVPDDESFGAVNRAFEAISAAGVSSIRLAPAE